MSDISVTPEIEFPKTPEKPGLDYAPVRFRLPEYVSPESSLTVRVANTLLEGTDALYQLTLPHATHPIILDKLRTDPITGIPTDSIKENRDDLDIYRRNVLGLNKLLQDLRNAALDYEDHPVETQEELVEDKIRSIELTVKETLGNKIAQFRQSNLEISGDEMLLGKVIEKFGVILHDIANDAAPLANIQLLLRGVRTGVPEERLQAYSDMIYDKSQEIREFSSAVPDMVMDRYPKKAIAISSLESEIEKTVKRQARSNAKLALPALPSARGVDPSDSVLIHLRSFRNLVKNICYNVSDTFVRKAIKDREPLITVEFVRSGDNALLIKFRDNGPGFSDDFLERGFIEGNSETAEYKARDSQNNDQLVGGKGVGMAGHRQLIQQIYPDGDLYPSNIVDEQGNIIGGMVTMKIPLSPSLEP